MYTLFINYFAIKVLLQSNTKKKKILIGILTDFSLFSEVTSSKGSEIKCTNEMFWKMLTSSFFHVQDFKYNVAQRF